MSTGDDFVEDLNIKKVKRIFRVKFSQNIRKYNRGKKFTGKIKTLADLKHNKTTTKSGLNERTVAALVPQ